MDWLNELPSGAWAVIGAVVAGLISWGAVVWQNRAQAKRDERARAALVADRKRDERRSAYAGLLLSAQRADAKIRRHFNEEQFNFGQPTYPGVENYDHVWELITGDFNENVALARLVASDSIRNDIDAVSTYLHACVWSIVELGKRPSDEPHPIQVLEDTMAAELEYRDGPPESAGAGKSAP
ncbi:hypothetical protein [Demequina sp. NBRC 110052]|uniref:hypothetical protein n=1 Tax=Demequina sp. NBRC 110052 TaxID=1570341 RepID=UPI0009FFF5FA|nr:hypothetical protein [Demequina sp. NBRC 110052]